MRVSLWFLVVLCQVMTVISSSRDHDYVKHFATEKKFVTAVRSRFMQKMEDVTDQCNGDALHQHQCWAGKMVAQCGDICAMFSRRWPRNCDDRCMAEMTHAVRESMYNTHSKEHCRSDCDDDPSSIYCIDCKGDMWKEVVKKFSS